MGNKKPPATFKQESCRGFLFGDIMGLFHDGVKRRMAKDCNNCYQRFFKKSLESLIQKLLKIVNW